MNAFKTLSAATFAIATVAVVASAPINANASILETLERIEEQGSSSESGIHNKNFRPDFLQKVEANSASSESGIYNKNFRPDFVQKVEANSSSSESGVYNKNFRPEFVQKSRSQLFK